MDESHGVLNITDAPQKIKKKRGRPPKNDDFEGNTPKPKAPKKERGPKLGTLQHQIAQCFLGTETALFNTSEQTFRFFADARGRKRVVEVGEWNLCRDVSLEYLTSCILEYCYTELAHLDFYHFTHSQAEGCAKMLLALAPIEKTAPRAFAFADELDVLCYHRVPFKLEPGPCPDWDKWENQIVNNRDAVVGWVGSLLDNLASRQQYLYLYGDGNDGKSTLIRFLFRVFGEAAESQAALPDLRNKHWATTYANKRLIVYPDFEDYQALSRGIAKTLAGDDPVYVDPKGEQGYTVLLCCMLLFAANDLPVLSSKIADQRRPILGEMHTYTGDEDPGFEARLWEQGGHWLWRCREKFRQLCPDRGRIPVSKESKAELEDIAAEAESDFQNFFEDNIIVKENGHIMPRDLQDRMKSAFPDHKARTSLLGWLKRKHKMRKVSVRDENFDTPRGMYVGFELNMSVVAHFRG